MTERYEFARSARKHRVGKRRALHVISHNNPEEVGDQRAWIGPDLDGVVLEILAVLRPDCWLVIHVMPTQYRRSR
jgi:hypothetical protein